MHQDPVFDVITELSAELAGSQVLAWVDILTQRLDMRIWEAEVTEINSFSLLLTQLAQRPEVLADKGRLTKLITLVEQLNHFL
jgi:hypothetical protein